MLMNIGRPAPLATKHASNSAMISSIVIVFPTMTLNSISTPSDFRFSTSLSTMRLGRRNSGIPYRNTPPESCSASKTCTAWPMRASSPAAVSPPGPEPTTATFLPVAAMSRVGASMFASAQSATNRSSHPTATGSPFNPRMHLASHCTSCGQTRPVVAGSALLVRKILAAVSKSPSATFVTKFGISTRTGHPRMHGFLGQSRHRLASSTATDSSSPRFTSSNPWTRSLAGRSRMETRSIAIRSFAVKSLLIVFPVPSFGSWV